MAKTKFLPTVTDPGINAMGLPPPEIAQHRMDAKRSFQLQHVTRFDIILNLMFLVGTIVLFYFVMLH